MNPKIKRIFRLNLPNIANNPSVRIIQAFIIEKAK